MPPITLASQSEHFIQPGVVGSAQIDRKTIDHQRELMGRAGVSPPGDGADADSAFHGGAGLRAGEAELIERLFPMPVGIPKIRVRQPDPHGILPIIGDFRLQNVTARAYDGEFRSGPMGSAPPLPAHPDGCRGGIGLYRFHPAIAQRLRRSDFQAHRKPDSGADKTDKVVASHQLGRLEIAGTAFEILVIALTLLEGRQRRIGIGLCGEDVDNDLVLSRRQAARHLVFRPGKHPLEIPEFLAIEEDFRADIDPLEHKKYRVLCARLPGELPAIPPMVFLHRNKADEILLHHGIGNDSEFMKLDMDFAGNGNLPQGVLGKNRHCGAGML